MSPPDDELTIDWLAVDNPAADQVAAMVDASRPKRPRRPRAPSMGPKQRMDVEAQMRAACASGEWAGLDGRHLAALHHFHFRCVYAVEPVLTGKEAAFAASLARRFCAAHFDDDVGACAEYVRAAWHREARAERWRRANGRPGRLLTWHRIFSAAHLTDHRVQEMRLRERAS